MAVTSELRLYGLRGPGGGGGEADQPTAGGAGSCCRAPGGAHGSYGGRPSLPNDMIGTLAGQTVCNLEDMDDIGDGVADESDPVLEAPGLPVPRWLGAVFLLMAALTAAWIAELWVTQPYRDVSAHYRLAWVGFDAMLALVLARTGWLAWRGRDHVELPAVAAATLLIVDSWFDIVTASHPQDLALAVTSAVLVELPLAALCFWIARNAERVRRRRLSWALLVDPQSLRR
jgi:hypothetical protein